MTQRTYLAIDLKSYYASAECAARHLDPLTTNLVVADASRTEKTICLAVSPSLKSYGIPGRARLFEVVQHVKEVNNGRLRDAIRNKTAVYKDGVPSLAAAFYDATALAADSSLEVSYLVAPPRMAYYEKISRQIYGIYLKYIAPEDIVVYSIRQAPAGQKDMKVVVRYFIKATEGTGKYISLTSTVVMIDPVYRELKVMQDSDRKAVGIEKELPVIIPFGDIIELSGEGITNIEDYLGIEKYPDDI